MTASYASLLDIDARLAAAGHHPLTTWWRADDQLRRFYDHPTANTLIAMVGRGGAKSHTAVKISLNEVLCSAWSVPPGERHYWAFVSVSKDEADQRLTLIESFLRALGIRFVTDGDTIALLDLPLGWRVFAGTIAAASGFRCLGYSIDEAAKIQVKGKNPLQEIAASLNAMCVTHQRERAKRLLISSPQSKLDYFYERWEQGDTATQVTLHAPTWIANDAVSREETILAEPDPRFHAREYEAIASDIEEDSFFGTAIDDAIDVDRTSAEPHRPGRTYWVAIDQAFQRDFFGYAVVTSEPGKWDAVEKARESHRVTIVQEADSWRPAGTKPSDMLRRLKSDVLSRFGNERQITGDQDSIAPLIELADNVGLRLSKISWTGTGEESKLERFRAVRLAMLQGSLRLPNSPKLIAELRAIRTVITETGHESIRQPRSLHGGHCDAGTAAVLACSIALGKRPRIPDSELRPHERFNRDHRIEIMMGLEQPRTPHDHENAAVYCGSVLRRIGGEP